MAADNKIDSVANNRVVTLAYKLTVDGEVIDEADDKDAIVFLQGHKNIIPGLESELNGMKVGETKQVTVSPEGGYGDVDEDQIDEVDLGDFPEGVEPQVGLELEMADEDGQPVYGKVLEVGEESATVDFNHPLAGKDLNFEVTVVSVRNATPEELSHGHVHGPGGHH
jgi:FKBP-type peptidyl-prolyl cis-trans isomerase SlyD